MRKQKVRRRKLMRRISLCVRQGLGVRKILGVKSSTHKFELMRKIRVLPKKSFTLSQCKRYPKSKCFQAYPSKKTLSKPIALKIKPRKPYA